MYNPDEDYQVMLAKLKTICQNKNITQYALAKATGMSTSSISCLMRGETKPYIYTVLTICDALNVTIADLLERHLRILPRIFHSRLSVQRDLFLLSR